MHNLHLKNSCQTPGVKLMTQLQEAKLLNRIALRELLVNWAKVTILWLPIVIYNNQGTKEFHHNCPMQKLHIKIFVYLIVYGLTRVVRLRHLAKWTSTGSVFEHCDNLPMTFVLLQWHLVLVRTFGVMYDHTIFYASISPDQTSGHMWSELSTWLLLLNLPQGFVWVCKC